MNIPTSLGELVDKITILEIKKSMIKDSTKLKYVEFEFDLLSSILNESSVEIPEILRQKLYAINLSLWNIEDEIRKKESRLEFGDEFIELARSVYQTNDMRSLVKRQITELDKNSIVQEQKSYA
jgi:hypothetical protein